MTVYFDNSATTKPCEAAVRAAQSAITETWGNPSSLHILGAQAASLLKSSRHDVASLIGCPDDSFYFTNSGTCANNTAVFGAYEKLRHDGNRIVTTALEHPSISEPLKRLEEKGIEVIKILPDKSGKINEDEFFSAIDKNTILVSCMAVNNEVGSILPVSSIRSAVRAAGAPALIHSDCVQACGKIDISPRRLDVDMLTVSGHKIHALKGIGGIFLRSKTDIKPYVLGGGQEKNVFSGTEAMPAVASFGAAAREAKDIKAHWNETKAIKDIIVNGICDIPCVTINSPEDAIPYILNISVLGLPSQPIVNFLSEKNICISAGSACKMGHRSPVLTAMKLAPEIIDSAVRISLSRFNTEEDAETLVNAIKELAEKYGKKR